MHPPSNKKRKPTSREVRILGGVYLGVTVLLGALVWHKAHSAGILAACAEASPAFPCLAKALPWQGWIAGLFAVLGILCLALGRHAAPVHRAWTALGTGMGKAVSPVVLGILYFGLVTPFALLFRMFKKNPLGLRPESGRESYWGDPPERKSSGKRLIRQY